MRYLLLLLPLFFGCGELQQIADQLPEDGSYISEAEIGEGLKQALQKGIDEQVSKLSREDGFLMNQLVRITLPSELEKVDRTFREMGLGKIADEGVKMLNRAAENAVAEATPIFVDAIKEINFQDARNILHGGNTAATEYLKTKTTQSLYARFHPIIENSFEKVGANKVWNQIISRYNELPFTTPVNPNLTDHVTLEAQEGVYTMIAIEEKRIRKEITQRTTDLLKKVFALQDQVK